MVMKIKTFKVKYYKKRAINNEKNKNTNKHER